MAVKNLTVVSREAVELSQSLDIAQQAASHTAKVVGQRVKAFGVYGSIPKRLRMLKGI